MVGAPATPRRIRAVLFDLGNTLVDDRDYDEMERVAHTIGIDADAEGFAHTYREVDREYDAGGGTMGVGGFWTEVLQRLRGGPVSADQVRAFCERMAARVTPAQRFSDTQRCLDELRRRGRALGVITNGRTEEIAREILDRTGILRYFQVVVAAGTEGIAKPHPGIFQRALDLLKVSARETVYVGDLPNVDARAARDAGLFGVWLNREGTGFGDDPPEITSLTELPGFIRALELVR
ncbi:MAG: HAD family hydrolase [Thermoplasmata archaeon]|nr:HAD family hydrolase [Thermoplasmata archaeon]